MMVINTDSLTSMSATIGGGFFGGLLVGWGFKESNQNASYSGWDISSRTSFSAISTNSYYTLA
jgi:hypothetical protein